MRHHFPSLPRALSALCVMCSALFLMGCAQTGYYPPSESSAGQKSGVTVFGEIDTSVVHTR